MVSEDWLVLAGIFIQMDRLPQISISIVSQDRQFTQTPLHEAYFCDQSLSAFPD